MTKLNLKPFDLDKAIANPDKVVTAEGRSVRILATDLRGGDYPVAAAELDVDGKESLDRYTITGRVYSHQESDGDLKLLPEKRSGWVNVYRDDTVGIIYPSKVSAVASAFSNTVATIEIEWEV